MERFRNILFVSQGLFDETSALKQALSIARNNEAALHVVLVCPELPKEMRDYKEKYELSLVEQVKASFRSALQAIRLSSGDTSVDIESDTSNPFAIQLGKTTIQIEVDRGSEPTVRVIRRALKNGHDLIIKEAEPKEGGKGFRAIDMELLRKCPCPVLLSRPISRHREEIQVAVAVDPEDLAPESRGLSVRLLQVARSYADTCSGELHVISCWDYAFEGSLRHNPWIAMKSEEVDGVVRAACDHSHTALKRLIEESQISGKVSVHHVRGGPDKVIPQHLEENGIDILVMGTVGRTGIPGFIIGNTAENIVQKLGCSLLALKPSGFVSPVKG